MGGINTAQFSDIDIDDDGFKDLVLFDKTDEKILPFINDGIVGQVSYTYAPQYESIFPKLRGWALFEDFDSDGLEDIFTHNISGVKVYKTSRVAGELQFEVVVNTCRFTSLSGNAVNILVTGVDIPAFVDVNEDGDMDILTFDQFGGTVEWYENQDVESGGMIDSLYFEKVDECWGDFFESSDTNAVDLNVACRSGLEVEQEEILHAGSTLLAFDMDGDLDKELMLGDISFPYVTQLTNGGDPSDAIISSQDPLFPSYDITADIFVFPSMFRLDVNNDGAQDLIISTNERPFAENYKNVLFYKNINDDVNPLYEFQTSEFLVGTNIDVGQAARPSFVDVDQDGDQDLLLGNLGYFDRTLKDIRSSLTFYENIGDSLSPEFQLIDRDFNSLSQFDIPGIYPDFADLDQDGDMDMVWGDEEGYIHLFENVALAGDMMNLVLVSDSINDEDFGKRIQPFLKDVSGDGKVDLICGERSGNLIYLKNTTSGTNWEFSPVTELWGNVDVQPIGAVFGFSTPLILPIDTSGRDLLLVSNMIGEVSIYDSLHLETFHKVDSFFLDSMDYINYAQTATNISRFSGFDMVDLDMDSKWELFAGRERGGMSAFKQTSEYALPIDSMPPNDTTSTVEWIELDVYLYPNPADDYLKIETESIQSSECLLYDIRGKNLAKLSIVAGEINVSELSTGVYFLKFIQGQKSQSLRFIKK